MNAFLDAIDLSANLQRAIGAVRSITGLPALVLAGALSLICLALAPLIWYFDIGATLDFTSIAVGVVLPSIPGDYYAYFEVLALLLTILPTLVELFGARFAQAGIRVAGWLVYLFSVFDMLTDWPRVAEFMEAYRDLFSGLGWFAGVAFFLVRALFLFLASFGFEMLFVVFAVCALLLFINSSHRRAPAPKSGEV